MKARRSIARRGPTVTARSPRRPTAPGRGGRAGEIESIDLRLGLWLVPLALQTDGALRPWLDRVRSAAEEDLGAAVPPIRIIDDPSLGGDTYALRVDGVDLLRCAARVKRGPVRAPIESGGGQASCDDAPEDLPTMEDATLRRAGLRPVPDRDPASEASAAIAYHVALTLRDAVCAARTGDGSLPALLRELELAGGAATAPSLDFVRQRLAAVRSRTAGRDRRVTLDGL